MSAAEVVLVAVTASLVTAFAMLFVALTRRSRQARGQDETHPS